jgi:hypothetical protein
MDGDGCGVLQEVSGRVANLQVRVGWFDPSSGSGTRTFPLTLHSEFQLDPHKAALRQGDAVKMKMPNSHSDSRKLRRECWPGFTINTIAIPAMCQPKALHGALTSPLRQRGALCQLTADDL